MGRVDVAMDILENAVATAESEDAPRRFATNSGGAGHRNGIRQNNIYLYQFFMV
jgi:hypothetical protein